MINVQPYIDKLDYLREYMNGLVDGKWYGQGITVNIEAIPKLSPNDILRLFYETGMLFYSNDIQMTETKRSLTFDEYYQQQLKK